MLERATPSGPPPVPQTAASAPAPAPIPTSPSAFEPTCDTHRPPMLLPHPVQLSPRNTTHTCSSTDNRTVWLQCRRHPHRCRLPYFNLKGGPCPKTSLHAPCRAGMVPASRGYAGAVVWHVFKCSPDHTREQPGIWAAHVRRQSCTGTCPGTTPLQSLHLAPA